MGCGPSTCRRLGLAPERAFRAAERGASVYFGESSLWKHCYSSHVSLAGKSLVQCLLHRPHRQFRWPSEGTSIPRREQKRPKTSPWNNLVHMPMMTCLSVCQADFTEGSPSNTSKLKTFFLSLLSYIYYGFSRCPAIGIDSNQCLPK